MLDTNNSVFGYQEAVSVAGCLGYDVLVRNG